LWGLAYRITGSAEDADDVVQEAFARLVAQPPETPVGDLGPWLRRVATNLGIDALRRRRRRSYLGPWLPSPVETSDADWLDARAGEDPGPEVRSGLAESVTYAFVLALEALGPRQRAVLLLRDVLGCSALETADLIGRRDSRAPPARTPRARGVRQGALHPDAGAARASPRGAPAVPRLPARPGRARARGDPRRIGPHRDGRRRRWRWRRRWPGPRGRST
jgi:RNA polymerase sigma factor (sigma-70 family)